MSICPRCLANARISVPMFILADSGSDERDEIVLGELVIRAKREAERWVLTLSGELDLASAPALQQQLDAAHANGVPRVLVDLSGLEFLDSTGLQVLLYADRRLRENGQALSLRRGPSAIQRVFELTHMDSIFRFED
jgi:anti-sigma B factor antagonist